MADIKKNNNNNNGEVWTVCKSLDYSTRAFRI